MKIIFLFSFAFFTFCFTYFFINKLKVKINKKKPFDLKNLPKNKKRVLVSFIVFLGLSLLLQNIIFALISCILYCYFDWYIQDKKRRKKEALIDKQVIEALNIIKSAVRAGQSLQNAIFTTKNELKYPIKGEFEKISERLAFGMNFDKVLEESSKNAISKEFKLMIDVIRVSKDAGSSLSDIFDRISESTIQRINVQSKMTALTAQGRISGNIVSFIPFVVMLIMYMIEPEMMECLFITLIGNILLLIVIVMVITGSVVIRKMTEIDF
jgi:tight adherence protein B